MVVALSVFNLNGLLSLRLMAEVSLVKDRCGLEEGVDEISWKF